MRKLLIVPIIHSQEGFLGSGEVENSFSTLHANLGVKLSAGQSQNYWRLVNEGLERKKPTIARVFFEGHFQETIEPGRLDESVSPSTPEFATVKNLLDAGYTLEHTEDQALHERARSIFDKMLTIDSEITEQEKTGTISEEVVEQRRTLEELYADLQFAQFERDKYISGRVNESLRDGETGILFIGANHKFIPKLLQPDITHEPLDERIDEAAREILKEGKSNAGELENSHHLGGESKE
jgi:hypothetical protein